MKKQAYFNRTAYLPCHPTKAQNMSLSELVVFWQDQKKSVLYEHYFGREKLDSVNAKYLNRTSFDGENWTLGLHNVQIKDMGLYDCFIQKKTPKGSVILQQTNTELSVIGMWSVLCSDGWSARWDYKWAEKHWDRGADGARRQKRAVSRKSILEKVGSESGKQKALRTSMVCFLGVGENFP